MQARRQEELEAPPGFEPGNGGFANLSLNHLGMAPADRPLIEVRQRVKGGCAVLSLVVIARDEEDRLGRCLRSVPFASERVVVVDHRTVDDTARVARREGARVFVEPWRGFSAQKNWALERVDTPWVLALDADEWLEERGSTAIQDAIGQGGSPYRAFRLPRCSEWLGTRIRHGKWYPDYQVRLFRSGFGRWHGGGVHERLEVNGPIGTLNAELGHAPYRTIWEHFDTIDRYTRLHAAALCAEGVGAWTGKGVVHGMLHFADAVLRKSAWRDGAPGLSVAGLGAAYVALKWRRVRALQGATL